MDLGHGRAEGAERAEPGKTYSRHHVRHPAALHARCSTHSETRRRAAARPAPRGVPHRRGRRRRARHRGKSTLADPGAVLTCARSASRHSIHAAWSSSSVPSAPSCSKRAQPPPRTLLDGRRVVNVNSTATGGGVAELLQTLLAYVRGVGIDARWVVIDGDPEFFGITKRIHNHLYGSTGDGGPLGANEHASYERSMQRNAGELLSYVHPGDIVILHDPQTAGLTHAVRTAGYARWSGAATSGATRRTTRPSTAGTSCAPTSTTSTGSCSPAPISHHLGGAAISCT